MRSVLCAVVMLAAIPAFADDKLEVRLLKDVKPKESEKYGEPKPVEITTADELAKSTAFDDANRDAVKKAVNFDKEKLVVLAWSGSGQDRITPELKTTNKKLTAVFTYSAGATDDLRRHAFAFAVPKDAKVEVTK